MWLDHAVPRLQAIGLGTEVASRTYRLTGIGESQVADLLGEDVLRGTNPIVATYARAEAVDVRISATAAPPRAATQLVEEAASVVLERLGSYVWATGEATWTDVLGARLGDLGWTLAAVEIGTGGSLLGLLGEAPWFRFDEILDPEAPAAQAHAAAGDGDDDESARDLMFFARRARELGGAEVGVAVRARPRAGDTAVSIAVSTPSIEREVRRVVFLTGAMGRMRSGLSVAAFTLEVLRASDSPG
jgi:hypothetical protein